MLQIILAVIGISIVSTMGFIILEQLSMQNLIQVQRENVRRLDVAAEGLTGALGRLPGVDTLVAPAPVLSANGWSTLPSSVGAVNSTVSGLPFLYCPVVNTPLSTDELEAVAPVSADNVQMADGASYAIGTAGGYVVSSSGITLDSEISSDFNPVAFIVAPGSRAETPPSCADIKVVNNVAVVEGGLVRVVSMPSGVASVGTGADAAAEFWVSSSGTGNGSQASPSSIDAALSHFSKYSPDTMTIHVSGSVTPSVSVWNRFATASANSGSKLRLIGGGSGALNINVGGGAYNAWNVPASTFFEGISISGPQVVVGAGDSLFNIGTVNYTPISGTSIAILVNEGGRLSGSSSVIRVSNENNYAIQSAGSVDLRQSSVRSGAGQLANFVWLKGGGSLKMLTSNLGVTADRPLSSSIASEGAIEITSDSASTAAASTGSNGCWASGTGDVAFAWSETGPGKRSGVLAETNYPAPASGATAAEIQAYQDGYNSRFRARRVNASDILCQ